MISAQAFVLKWIEFAAAGTILLLAAKVAMSRLRQPADRINLILMTFFAAAIIPLVLVLAPLPVWHLGIVTADQTFDVSRVSNRSVSHAPQGSASEGVSRHQELTQPATRDAIARAVANGSSSRAPAAAPSKPLDGWRLAAMVLLATHCLAAALFATEAVIADLWLRRLSARSRLAGSNVQAAWVQITQGRGGAVGLLFSSDVATPLTYGWLRPTVIVPESIAAGDATVLRFCLAHEWSHVENGDLRHWRLAWACQFLLWFQPSFWLLRRELRVCQDLLADHRATRAGRDALEYSQLLLTFARQQAGRPIAGAIAFVDCSSQLSRRINMLLNSTPVLRSRSSWAFRVSLAALALVAAALVGHAPRLRSG